MFTRQGSNLFHMKCKIGGTLNKLPFFAFCIDLKPQHAHLIINYIRKFYIHKKGQHNNQTMRNMWMIFCNQLYLRFVKHLSIIIRIVLMPLINKNKNMHRRNPRYSLKYHLSKLLVFATKPNEIPEADELRARYMLDY